MLKTRKLCLAVSALLLIFFMVTIFIGCTKGEVTTPAGTTTTPAGTTTNPNAGSVSPKPGATFSGSIEITGKASSGTIEFSISEDGASVTSVSVTLKDLKT